jgi:hypothetical protein
MPEEDDKAWLDALAGRGAPSLSRAADQEVRMLREGINSIIREGDGGTVGVDPAREAALIARARREGLLPERPSRGLSRRAWSIASGALAAVALLASVVVGLYRNSLPPAQTYRGAQSGVVRLQATDPAAFQRQLIGELRDAGVQVAGYQRLGRYGIDADLPTPVPAAVQELLQRHRVPLPANGALAIEIDSYPP